MQPIDFTNQAQRKKIYGGTNGSKIAVLYQGEQYMLKFPYHVQKNKVRTDTNSCFSEYLGCKIYKSIGIPVQEVLLGTYVFRGKERIVVACKDFTEPGIVLQDFASLKNRMFDLDLHGNGAELGDILQIIEKQNLVDPIGLMERFWDMFIVDALIGNSNRNNGNWGFLYNDQADEVSLAPVYDCGSCLYPQTDDKTMEQILTDRTQMEKCIFDVPCSAIMVNGKKIRYYDFISSLQYDGCNQALQRILPRINMEKIEEIIENTPLISELQKRFYVMLLQERKTQILDYSMDAWKSKR